MPKCSALDNAGFIFFDSTIKPCCRFQEGRSKTIIKKSILGYQKSNFLFDIKNKMETGWHQGCTSCQKDESLGLASLRTYHNSKLSGSANSLERLDLNLSNKCNLSCRMCDNKKSSKWECYLNENNELLKYDFSNYSNPNFIKKTNIEDLFANIDISNLHTINYLGGEPFISNNDLEDLVLFLDKKNVIKNINFSCYTNATFYPKKIIPLLLKFKSLNINFSVDGLDELTNYVRSGAKWERVNSVINTWLKLSNQKINFVIHNTLYSLNVHHYENVKNFSIQKNLPFVFINLFRPKYLSIDVLPIKYREHLIENKIIKDEKILNILRSVPFDELNFKKFVDYIKLTDKVLGTDINKTIPELALHLI